MGKQAENLVIDTPKNTNFIRAAFTHNATAKLAEVLVDMIHRNEPEVNFDECIEAMWLELGKKLDKKSSYPVSCMFLSEIEKKVTAKLATGYFRPIIQN